MMIFEKVPFDIYKQCREGVDEQIVKKEWENIKIPTRGTSGSAGYDFFVPYTVNLKSGKYETLPTGIRFKTDRNDVVLLIAPRSGLGFKNMVRLANTTGVIDSDYCNSDNYGHIMMKVTCEKDVEILEGKGIAQGIILPFYVTDNDITKDSRNGGFGSTNR